MNLMRNFFGGGNGNSGDGSGFFGRFGNIVQLFSRFQQFMQNPFGAFMNSDLDIPQNIRNNPEAITNYLRSSGRMTDDQFNQASQAAGWAQKMFSMFGKKF